MLRFVPRVGGKVFQAPLHIVVPAMLYILQKIAYTVYLFIVSAPL